MEPSPSPLVTIQSVVGSSSQWHGCLRGLGFSNIETRSGDDYYGRPEHAPYACILVTAAVPLIPQPLVEQLKPGGRMAIPVGLPFSRQELMLAYKSG